jgi:Protein of unknown function (DUF3017)
MANRPANAGSGSIGTGSVGSPSGLAPMGDVAPPFEAAASAAAPRTSAAAPGAPAAASGAPAVHRAARPRTPTGRESADRGESEAGGVGWLPYLIVLAGVAAGIVVAWQGSKRAAPCAAVVGCSLLAAALARLALPDRYAGLLASRRKASDMLAFAVLGAAVLAVVLSLP